MRLEAMAAQVAKELVEARMDVESCDRLIKKYDPRLRPELIEPIREWRPPQKQARGSQVNAANRLELKSKISLTVPFH